jgi:AraC-like DNA-binding protein
MASVAMDFPVLGHAHISDDEVVVAVITSAPKLAQWSGVDLHPGTVLVYGPGAHHTGHTPAGLEFTYLTLRVRGLEERIGFGTDMPAAGTVGIFQSIGGGKGLANDMEAIACDANLNDSPTAMSEGVEALIGLVMNNDPVVTSRRLATSRLIVGECIRAADAREAAISVPELLRAISTSSRRLRQAFADTYGVPPKRYLQLRTIDRANERLATNGSRCNTVTQVAIDLGISHMGRFAAQYREVFGEHPSTTLDRSRSFEVDGAA